MIDQRKPYLSICIPTYNRQELLNKTISSIFADLEGVSLDDFEVVISDNSKEGTCKDVVTFFKYVNIHYFHTQCEGFMNSYHSLCYGSGQYLKLHNNYTMLRKGSLKRLIDILKENESKKAFFFFSNGLLGIGKILYFGSFDEFMYLLSYFSSWSSGFGVWKDDFDKIKNKILDPMFPQTTLLLSVNNKSKYVVYDKVIFEDQFVPKKGGYNIFKVFSIDYINLIKRALEEGVISERTFNHIKRQLLYRYMSVRYFKTVIAKMDNFEAVNIRQHICANYNLVQYYKFLLCSYIAPSVIVFRKLVYKINSMKSENR